MRRIITFAAAGFVTMFNMALGGGEMQCQEVSISGIRPATIADLEAEPGKPFCGVQSDCPADLDGDDTVNVVDLLSLLSQWGPCEGCDADLNGDSIVDVVDLLALLSAWGPCPADEDKRIVAYYIEWGIYGRNYHPMDIPAEKITHINYAFANLGADLKIALGDAYAAIDKYYPGDTWDQPYRGTYNQLNNVLRAEYPHIRTLISVGGWTWSKYFSDVALTEETRAVFAQSCVEFIRQYNFDGVDIDWEYPVCCGLPDNHYRPEDKENYTLLMAELRSQLDAAGVEDDREYLLTIASPAGYDKMENIELGPLAEQLDWMNIMCYDLRGAWDLTMTGHHGALYPNPDDPADPDIAAMYNGEYAIQHHLDEGVPADKIVMGVPFYGRAWGGVPNVDGGLFQPATHVPPGTWDDWASGATGVNDFWEIEQYEASGGYTKFWDDHTKAPYLYNPGAHGGHFIGYDDEQSMGIKVDYVNESGLGGIMLWEITADRNETLLDVIFEGLQ